MRQLLHSRRRMAAGIIACGIALASMVGQAATAGASTELPGLPPLPDSIPTSVQEAVASSNDPQWTGLKVSAVGQAASDVALMDPQTGIIVLGARLNEDCTPPAVLVDRVNKARELSWRHPLNPIIVTGGVTQPGCPSEAQVMKDMLDSTVANPVHMEDNAQSTVDNARYSSPKVQRAGVIVSSPNHIPRALQTFGGTDDGKVWLAVASRMK